MRTEDLRYLQLLDRLRYGQCNYDDYELLQTRAVGQPSIESLHDSPWNKAPILVFRNEIRTQINNKAAIHNATQIGHPLMIRNEKKSNQKTILSIKRTALPLVPAYCITTHKSQGQTLSKVVIDLKLPNETDDIAAVYVPLSRVKRLVDLAIIRPFDNKVLLMKPSKSQVTEMERLDQLFLNTRSRFPEWFQ
ncbi:unnamed protein product [Adineta ricciae]|uniref:UvrD-like helicase C-terminal domain-containing protein n=1 Tax=Adineta ricciae TaxID=249248 RepID=A0A815NMJ4_ADIRI|nr:unnamed protein product [Adineta ricciae]